MLVRVDHIASRIINGNHRMVRAAVELRISDCIRHGFRAGVPQPTETAAHRRSDRRRDDPCAVGLRKRAHDLSVNNGDSLAWVIRCGSKGQRSELSWPPSDQKYSTSQLGATAHFLCMSYLEGAEKRFLSVSRG